MKRVSFFHLATVLAGLALWPAASAVADPPPTVLIVDASGSMAAKEADGGTKLDAAREAIAAALADWKPNAQLAVIAYGHRRKSDCADIEVLAPTGPLALPELKRKLATLRARGKTPLSESLRRAASLLPESGGAIVLVSDGMETCKADPCAVALALAQAHANLVIHVIGFGVTPEETAQLRCIAENGAGHYFDAADAGALTTALGNVAAEIGNEAPAAPPAPPQPVTLVATAGDLGEIADAPVRWRVTAANGESVYEGTSRGLALTLPPGEYRATASAANARGEASFAVAPKGANRFTVHIAAGRLDLSLAASAKAEPFGDEETRGLLWTLEPLDGQGPVEVLPIARPSLLLAPGRYRVKARLNDMRAEAVAKIAPGKPAAAKLDFALGSLVLEAALTADGQPLDDPGMLAWRVGAGEAAHTVSGQARPRLTLRAGSYPVALSIAGAEISTEAKVVAGEEKLTRILVKGGELEPTARLGPNTPPLQDWRDAAWTVEAMAAVGVTPGTKAADELAQAAPKLPLSPGRWHVAVKSGTVKAERDVVVAPGTSLPLTIDLNAARLRMRATPANGEPPPNVVFSVFALGPDGTPAAKPVYEGGAPEELAVIFAAGPWHVVAAGGDRRAAADVTLAAGEERTLSLVLE